MTKTQIQKIKYNSQKNALISIISFSLFAVAIGIAVFGLYSLQSKVERKEMVLKQKEKEIAAKDTIIAFKEKRIESKAKVLNSLMQEINEMGDSTIYIECKFEKNDMPDNKGRATYDWSVWIRSSIHRLNQIEKVYYQANVEGIGRRHRASVERSNAFLVEFTYFDCLESVRVTLQYKGGEVQIIYFNSCERFNGFNFEQFQVTPELENVPEFVQQTISHPKVLEVLK